MSFTASVLRVMIASPSDIPDAREHIKLSMVNQTGSYTGFDGEKHTLLNGKENIRLEDIDDKNVVETETKD